MARAVLVSACIVDEEVEREEALLRVESGMAKAEIIALAGEPDEVRKPELCDKVEGAKYVPIDNRRTSEPSVNALANLSEVPSGKGSA